jgi:argininosuccinate synthase
VAFIANVGQGEDLEAIAQKAQQAGAEQVCVEDVQEEFVRDYVTPALRAHAVYEGITSWVRSWRVRSLHRSKST